MRLNYEDEKPDIPPLPNVNWTGVLALEGEWTGDGRCIAHNALRWENLPLPLLCLTSGNYGSAVVGRIDDIQRNEGGVITGRGILNPNVDWGGEAIRKVRDGEVTGIAMDLDNLVYEDGIPMLFTAGRICAAHLNARPAFESARIILED
jgi:hypothetical protein